MVRPPFDPPFPFVPSNPFDSPLIGEPTGDASPSNDFVWQDGSRMKTQSGGNFDTQAS